MENLLNAEDLAAVLRVGHSKLYLLIAQEGLKPTLYIGKSPRWTAEAVDKWVAARLINQNLNERNQR